MPIDARFLNALNSTRNISASIVKMKILTILNINATRSYLAKPIDVLKITRHISA